VTTSSHRIAYHTTGKLHGLWFLDQKALEELDSILDEALKDLQAQRKRDIENELQRRLRTYERIWHRPDKEPTEEEKTKRIKETRKEIETSYGCSHYTRELTIYCSPSRDLNIDRFSTAFGKPEVEHVTPMGFLAEIKCGQGDLKIALNKYSFLLNELDISVSPHTADVSSDIFTKLNAWAEAKRQPTWQYYWKKLAGLQWLLLYLIGTISFVLLSASTKEPLKAEARQLLQKGMTKDDDHRAIELLLSIASDYKKPTDGTPIVILLPRWYIICITFLFLACIAFSFPVNTAIGIGKGKKVLERQRRWLWWLQFLFVAFFFLAFGGSLLSVIFYDYITK